MKSAQIREFSGQYRFLSNFWPINPKTLHGYPTVEHFYQAMKTFDERDRKAIRLADTPGQAKRMGRKVHMRPDWEIQKQSIMAYAVGRKFRLNPELGQKLLDTGDRDLIEGNMWNDTYWGVCNGIGLNKLGSILMQTRESLQRGEP